MSRFIASTVAVLCSALTAGAAAAETRAQYNAPPNDAFRAAAPLPDSSLLTLGNLFFASRELGETRVSPSSLGRSVWYRYTAPVTGRAVLALATPDADVLAPLQAAVYRGTALASLVRVGTVQVAGQTNADKGAFAFDTVAGQTYHLQVDSAPQPGVIFNGYFLIGIRQFPAAGGLATFTEKPITLRESRGERRRVLVANGFRTIGTLQPTLTGFGTAVTVTTDTPALAVGGASWVRLQDVDLRSLPRVGATRGSLDMRLKTSGGSTLGTASEVVTGIRRDITNYPNNPVVKVRYQYPRQGVRGTAPVTSAVVVKNTSTRGTTGCTFVPNADVYGLKFQERNAAGALVNQNRTFDLAAGQVRRFVVSSAAAASLNDAVTVDCASTFITLGDAYLSTLGAFTTFAVDFPRVLVEPLGTDELRVVPLADFASRRVVVRLTSTGTFAGYFDVQVLDDPTNAKAVLESFCLSDQNGICTSASTTGTGTIRFDLAAREATHLTVSFRRGSSPESGYVRVQVRTATDEAPAAADAGYGGFEVAPAP